MPKAKKIRKPGVATRFFSKIGGGVLRTGSGIVRTARRVRGKAVVPLKPEEKVSEVARRLEELKQLQTLRGKGLEAEFKPAEKIWEERVELKRPLSERLAESFYIPLRKPAMRMVKFFKGLDEDLFKAGLRVPAERYVAMMIGVSIIVGIVTLLLLLLLLAPPPLALLGGAAGFLFTLVFGRIHPRSKASSRVADTNRAIPYALRHISTQLSSGIGLPETMTSVSKANYGTLSDEFGRMVRDMGRGLSMDEALVAMDRRIDSEPLHRAVRQIRRTLRTGGDLSSILGSLADETAFDLRMKLRDYTQSLNVMAMIYMFASAVLPAMLIVMTALSGFMGAVALPPEAIAMIFLVVLPFMLFYFVLMIKRREPRV